MIKRKKIGELLVAAGLLSAERLQEVIGHNRPAGMKLGQYLVREGIVREGDLIGVLAEQLNLAPYEPEEFPIEHELAKLIPPQLASKYQVIPLRRTDLLLTVAMSDPTDILAIDAIQEKVHLEVEPVICTGTQFNELMASLYGVDAKGGGVPHQIDDVEYGNQEDGEAEVTDAHTLKEMAEGLNAVRNVNWIISQAVWEGASDIHVSPEKTFLRIRLRVDGVLKDLPTLPRAMQRSIVSRIKILSGMDISSSRVPQDGRFTARLSNREVHARVSSLPTIHGENLVIRILDTSGLVYKLDHLGMNDDHRAMVDRIINQPHGLLLTTGPTGSGKTSTLYAVLNMLNRPDINIVTVEDPVEFRVGRIRQVELNTRAGMTFASSLRSILRQDPDVIMVGEIRDLETATVATQAALTGHLVLSTMHTNDAVSTVTRLKDMGLEAFLVSSVLRGVIAQRLVRRVCSHCSEPYPPTPALLEFWGDTQKEGLPSVYRRARGCQRCGQSGYRGRLGIYEILSVSEPVRDAILARLSENELAAIARSVGGFQTLRDDAGDKVRAGLTTPEEAATILVT